MKKFGDVEDFDLAKKACYQLAHAIGRDSKEQVALINALRESERLIAPEPEIIKTMLGMFYDGLAYGNWPWIKNGVNTLKDKK